MALTQEQDLALGLVGLHKVHTGSFLKPGKALLVGITPLKHISG